MTLLLIPFLTCILLGAIHALFGKEILKRGIIFTDLALAQIAALGIIIAHTLHLPNALTTPAAFLSTLVGAMILSKISQKDKKIQEALIGILYITGAALVILIISHTPGEATHLKTMLNGSLLFTTWPDLLKTTLLYLPIALLFKKAKTNNLLFFTLFGLVVTSSVQLAGILLVFSFLIIPNLAQPKYPTIFATLSSTLGLFLAYHLDLPTGATVVLSLTSLSLILTIYKSFTKK